MSRNQRVFDPFERLRQLNKSVGSDLALKRRKQMRLLLFGPVLLDLGLYFTLVQIWRPAQILLHVLTGFWLLDWAIVVLSSLTGVFAVPNIPTRARTRILMHAIWRSYLQPQTAWDSINAALRDARKARQASILLQMASKMPPDLQSNVETLVAAGKVEEAVFVTNQAIDEAKRINVLENELRRRARTAECAEAVERLLEADKTADAEHIIWRANVLLAEAEQFGVREAVVRLVRAEAYNRADEHLSEIRQKRARQSELQALSLRIQHTPEEHRDELRRRLADLSKLEFESRPYRKERYVLEKQIEKALGPPE